jgi:hypothetical protein
MVRRGSTVRVRQRALQKPRITGLFVSDRFAGSRTWGRYGAATKHRHQVAAIVSNRAGEISSIEALLLRQRRSSALVVGAASGQNQVMPGLLSRLFGTPPVRAAEHVESIEANLYPGDETLEVVGESHHQDALWRTVGGHRRDPVRYETEAVLELEAGNRHDANAIKVVIHGALVGYLSREDAAAYRPGVSRSVPRSSAAGRDRTGSASSAYFSTTIRPTSGSQLGTRPMAPV